MGVSLMRLINNFRFGSIAGILFLLSGSLAVSQEIPVWEKPVLKDSIIALLSKFQDLHNKLNDQTNSTAEREFIHLFSNSKVQVINDINGSSAEPKMSIEDFIVLLKDLFPNGLAINIDLNRLTMDQPRYDRNNRFIVRIRINRKLNGITRGKVFSSAQRVIFQIAFINNNGTPGNFSIYGMDLTPKGQSYITASGSPAFTGFVNPSLASDERLKPGNGVGYRGEIIYSFFFSDHWGISSGAGFSQYTGSLGLSKIDASGGFDPNLKDFLVDNSLWFVELPVLLSFRTNPAKRLELIADLGPSLGIRAFESMTSSAVNTNTGIRMINVITDTDWIGQMNRFNLGIVGTIAMKYRFKSHVGVLLGGGVRQGLSGLDHNVQAGFVSSRYQVQYNPLWGAPGKTINQAFFLHAGVAILLNRKEK
jgi:hypothetical protein